MTRSRPRLLTAAALLSGALLFAQAARADAPQPEQVLRSAADARDQVSFGPSGRTVRGLAADLREGGCRASVDFGSKGYLTITRDGIVPEQSPHGLDGAGTLTVSGAYTHRRLRLRLSFEGRTGCTGTDSVEFWLPSRPPAGATYRSSAQVARVGADGRSITYRRQWPRALELSGGAFEVSDDRSDDDVTRTFSLTGFFRSPDELVVEAVTEVESAEDEDQSPRVHRRHFVLKRRSGK